MSGTTLAAPNSVEEQAIVWERVATSLQSELNDAYAVAHRWQEYGFALEAQNEARLTTITGLEQIRDAQAREIRALRAANAARERTINRQLETIRDLTRRLPRVEQHTVTPAEAFRALHPIADVIGAVVDLEPHTDGYREYLAGRCPFHQDDHPSPSLVVRSWYGQFACHVCGAAGDVLEFLRLCKEQAT